jgi:hypothetical protein
MLGYGTPFFQCLYTPSMVQQHFNAPQDWHVYGAVWQREHAIVPPSWG